MLIHQCPTKVPSKDPTTSPTKEPSTSLTSNPTVSPTTAAPSHLGELTCDSKKSGDYNGLPLEIEVRMPHAGSMTLDASNSESQTL